MSEAATGSLLFSSKVLVHCRTSLESGKENQSQGKEREPWDLEVSLTSSWSCNQRFCGLSRK